MTVPVIFSTECGRSYSTYPTCLLKKTFIRTFALPANANGYVIAYERCCRNASIVNIQNPGNHGATYYCTIPGNSITNNSAVFTNYPPQVICINDPLYYDNSATDADGDSLTYGFCAALNGANNADIKPRPYFPNWYDTVQYIGPLYSSQSPFTGDPAITINPTTGIMTGTPSKLGRYLVTVYCNEWRGGVLINTIKREFQFIVTNCASIEYHPYAGKDTIVYVNESVHFHGTAASGFSWSPCTYLSDCSVADPVGTFPVAGYFHYTLTAVSDSGCKGTDTVNVWVLDHNQFLVPTAFTPNGDGLNDNLLPIPVLGATMDRFKVFNRKGNLVYDGGQDDPGWDGFYKGLKQDMGVYFWELRYVDNTGQKRIIKGDVTLIR